jgi:sugar transferase (PEP-CTERM/EpsH1 system associated)
VKPTICQVVHSLNIGGAEVLAARLARGLADRYRFVFACLDEPGTMSQSLRGEGFAVEWIGRRPGVDFGCMRRLAAVCRRHGVDVLHAHQYTPFFYGVTSRRWRRPPVLFTEHGRWFPDHPRWRRVLLNRMMLRRGDRVVAVGESVRQALIHNEGFSPCRVAVIYNGIDPVAFRHDTDRRTAVRESLGLCEDDFVIAQVARLDAIKDHATAIRTIQRVADRLDRARLILVGDGPQHDAIVAEIDRRGMGEQVRMLGLRHDIAQLLAAADVFLLTSVSEGIPVTVLEAMAVGLPVVSTDVGGMAEIVRPGKTGFLVPAGDDAWLADAILDLAGDPALRARLGQAGRNRVETVFSQEQMHAAYARLYEEMIHG